MQFKTQEELAVMQYANDIASAAHVELLRYAKPGELIMLHTHHSRWCSDGMAA